MLYPIELWVPLVPANLQAGPTARKRFERRFVPGCITSRFDHESRLFECVFPQGHAQARFRFELGHTFGEMDPARVEGRKLAVIHFAEFPIRRNKTKVDLGVEAEFRTKVMG